MLGQNTEYAKYIIAGRRHDLTSEEILKENYSMVVRIGEGIFRLRKESYNYMDDTRCFDFAKSQLESGLFYDHYIEWSECLNQELSEYEVAVFKEVVTSFYDIPQILCTCILESYDFEVVSITMTIIKDICEMNVNCVYNEPTIKQYAKNLNKEYNRYKESFDFNNGRERMKDFGKHKKNPRKDFKNNILIPLRSGEVQHHLTDTIIIGIQKEVHERLSGYDRETHRKKVIEWLDEQAEKAKIAHAYLVLDEKEK